MSVQGYSPPAMVAAIVANFSAVGIASPWRRASARAIAAAESWSGAGRYSEGSGSSCGMPSATAENYDVTADGQKFLMVRDDDANVMSKQIVVVMNWAEEVKRMERSAGARSTQTARREN